MRGKSTDNILLIVALLLGLLFLHNYLGVFALAALTTLLFTPLHDWLVNKKGYLAKFSIAITLTAVVFSVLIPLFVFIGLSVHEGQEIVSDIKENRVEYSNQVNSLSDIASGALTGAGVNISKESIRDRAEEFIKKVIPGIVDFIFKTTGSIATFVTAVIIYFMALATMLSRKYEIIALFKRLSPFSDNIDKEYLGRVKSMAISMVKGTFIIAVIVSFISCVTLWIIGFSYLIFWFMLFTLMSLIPLGAGIIYVPIGIILILTGNIWQGILILAVQFIILNNVDNVLRPKLAPSDSKLPGVLVLVSTFAGIGYFGIVGVVYGPIIMVLIYTTIELYDRHHGLGTSMLNNARKAT